jgi:predicted nucleic acid-binding protein
VEYLIDTSTLINAERGRLDLDEKLQIHPSASYFISVITASELFHGAERANDPARKFRRSQFIEGLLDRLPVLDVNLEIARVHAQLWAHLAARGQVIGAHDLWIAATATSRRMTVVTSNLRDYERVPGLEVEFWATD